MKTLSLFEPPVRMSMQESIDLTVQSMQSYGPDHKRWCIAWSGGKDSTATLTLILWLIESNRIQAPEQLTVFYADTRQELPPLAIAANQIMTQLRQRGVDVRVVMAPLDKRFLVYILGRGVPPPNNNTLRWCTRQIKVDPMAAAIAAMIAESDDTVLMITGVRQGESAIRDRRIEMSCSKDGAECGQGWYQQVLPEAKGVRGRIATLAPLLHWRVCHVWDWLRFFAPANEYGAWPTEMVADAYGGEEAEEINARTGCIGCPLAQRDAALETVIKMPQWTYLTPLMRLKPIYRELRKPENRLRKSGIELLKNGHIAKNPQRMGPLTMSARRWALDQVLSIQREVNASADKSARPHIDLLNTEEVTRINELIDAETWPNGWNGDEITGDIAIDKIFSDGSVQPIIF